MAKASEKLKLLYKDFLDSGSVFEHRGELHMKADCSSQSLDDFSAFDPAENAVVILGFPKCGSHLMLSIIDQLGIQRCESLVEKDEVLTGKPLDFNSKKEYDLMEKTISAHKQLVATPHCHASANLFPKNFKGKIVFITRDTEAVAVSAFHFYNKLPWLNEYMEYFGINEDVNKFAQRFFKGEDIFGDKDEYDQEWKNYVAANPSIKVEWFKYEEVLSNKPENIQRLATFLGVENPDISRIVEETSIDRTVANRKKAMEAAGKAWTDVDTACYRQGKKKTWRELLTAETLAMKR